MSILQKLFSSDNFKQQMFSRMAAEARKRGIKKILITINDKDGFETEIIDDSKIIVEKKNYLFLLDRYNKIKNTL